MVQSSDSVKNRSFQDVFNGTVRFEIPFFQRGYAWEKRQWDQLFVDIQEQIIDEIIDGRQLGDVEHFFGPIVVLEKTGGPAELKNLLVIDGQQRITTVYLLLAIIRSELESKKSLSDEAAGYATQLRKYLVNEVLGDDDYLKLKLFSSKGDRLPTYWVVFGANANPTTPLLQTDLQLYIHSKNKVAEFERYALKRLRAQFKDVPALWQLAQVILKSLKIVWIPLSEGRDDPQAIFESLNDKGMPLKASELLCNYLFRPIIDAKQQFEDLHTNQWLATIRILNGDDVFEDYLRNLLSIGENKMVGKGRKLYVQFKAKNRGLTASVARQLLNDIYLGAPLFLTIRNPQAHPHPDSEVTSILVSISNTRMDSSTPFVLSVLRAHKNGSMSVESVRSVLREVLTLLVRRKTAELATTQYDVMFPQLLARVEHEPDKIKALHEQFRKHNVWVSDQDFEYALVHKPIYRRTDVPFARMLLIEIDKTYQVHGQLPDYTTVGTIEHAMPQTLTADWKVYLGKDSEDERLPLLIDTIGNLCLLSGPANSSAGQDPFSTKKEGYSEVTALARQIRDHPGPWNLQAVVERSNLLAKKACAVWGWS